MAQQLLSPKEAGIILSLSRGSIYNHMQNGNIAYLKIGRSRRIKMSEINNFISLMERKMRVAQQ